MELNHIGITNKSEDQAVRFYQDFLGLEKTREILLAPELSEQLFSLYQEIKALVFEKPGVKIEVFISDFQHADPNFIHFGLMLDNFAEITEKAQRSHIELIIGKHKEKTVYFLKDFSGNLIEIKQKS
ncbi:MAG: VOC family protein [Candidatus Brocadia sp.]|nr:VOC family protein [Candidatus Brocadia sp.]NUO09540.1 VOC family protein [Candidatus Brocadia sp.]